MVIRPTPESVPWPIAFLLSRYHRKFQFTGSMLPNMADAMNGVKQLEYKLLWQWHHRFDDDDNVVWGIFCPVELQTN